MMKVECPCCDTLCDQGAAYCPMCGTTLPDVVTLVSDRASPPAQKPVRPPKQRKVDGRKPTTIAPGSDPHGQPYNVTFNVARRTERDLSEMLGLAKGMLADGVISDDEATYLYQWGQNHPDAVDKWPLNHVFSRLNKYFIDGRIDDVERADLKALLGHLVGGTASIVLGYEGATTLPLDAPPPLICYGPDDIYVFTGRFAYGTRRDCQKEVTSRGSACDENVTRRTSFLVIGTFGSRDWQQSSFGLKIRRAVELRDSGFAVRIVGEDHWAAALSAGV